MMQQTLECLKQMRLSVMAGEYSRQTELPGFNEMAFDERLSLIVDAEWRERRNSRLARLLKSADIKDKGACLEDLDYSAARKLDKAQVARLSDCQWVKQGKHMLITGACGTGKTYLTSAFAAAACRMGFTVRCFRTSRLLLNLQVGRGDGSWSRLLQEMKKPDLLVLDDFGLDNLDAVHCRDLLEVVDDRFDAKSILVASQLPVASWHGLFADPTIADAVLDRLVHKALRFELQGPSRRIEKIPS